MNDADIPGYAYELCGHGDTAHSGWQQYASCAEALATAEVVRSVFSLGHAFR